MRVKACVEMNLSIGKLANPYFPLGEREAPELIKLTGLKEVGAPQLTIRLAA